MAGRWPVIAKAVAGFLNSPEGGTLIDLLITHPAKPSGEHCQPTRVTSRRAGLTAIPGHVLLNLLTPWHCRRQRYASVERHCSESFRDARRWFGGKGAFQDVAV
jgi:hypothetical protein